jgi:hypothetical protein
MDKGTKSLLNVYLSVLAPVLVLDHCSSAGDSWYHMGTTWAMVVALSLPIACGVYSFVTEKKVELLTIFGLLGTILTGVVTVYANTGDGLAIRPDTPWWYASKEALIALLLAGAMLVNIRKEGSMLRAFVYSDAIFDVKTIEKTADEKGRRADYDATLNHAAYMTAASLFFSAAANFALALYFLLPVPGAPAAEQAELYNYAVSKMTWMGLLIIGVPLLITLMLVMRYLCKRIAAITELSDEKIFLPR